MKFRKLFDWIRHGRQLTCESCQSSFRCELLSGKCWCGDVKVPKETLRQWKGQYRECLCPACLRAAGQSTTS